MIPATYNERAIDLESPLFVCLTNCVDDRDFQAFAHRFGDLGGVDEMRELAGKLSEAAAFTLDEQVFEREGAQANRGVHVMVANKLLFSGDAGGVVPRLVVRAGRPRFVFEASSLAIFMALELGAAIEAGAFMRRCAHCHKAFLFGPMTKRRSTAQYCSDRCRAAATRFRKADQDVGS